MMPSTHHDDPSHLVHALRQAERRDDHAEAAALCAALLELGSWRPVWQHAERLLERAESDRGAGGEVLAREAARVLASLALLAGQLRAGERVPNPLQHYVHALHIWSPGGWFDWLARRCQLEVVEPVRPPAWLDALQTLTPVVTGLLARVGIHVDVRVQVEHSAPSRYPVRALCWPDDETVVLADGRCLCGARCPALPEVV